MSKLVEISCKTRSLSLLFIDITISIDSWLHGSSEVSCTGVCLTTALDDDDGGELKKDDDDDDDDGIVAVVNDTVAALVNADDDFGVDLTSSTKCSAGTYITALARGVCTIAALADTALVDPDDDDTALVDEDDEDEDTFAALAGDEDDVGDDDDAEASTMGAAGYLFDDIDDDDDADCLL